MASSVTIPQFIVVAAAAVLVQKQTWRYFSWIKFPSCHSGSSRNGYMENTLVIQKELILYLYIRCKVKVKQSH